MKVISRDTNKVATLIVDGAYKFVQKFAIEDDEGNRIAEYDSIEALYRDFKDYEEPKEHWCITMYGGVTRIKDDEEPINGLIEIGNYFNSKEDAYDALDNLKAWKRLKDKGFKVDLWDYDGGNYQERIRTGKILFRVKDYEENDKDLDLLFGGEE